MNENFYNCNDDEMEINLADLFFYLLKQWRTLLLAVIIGVLLGAGIYMVKRPAQVSGITDGSQEIAYENYEVDPSVRANMEIAAEYRELYYKQREYNKNSLLMQLDSGEVYRGKLSYYLEAGNDTQLISEQYANLLYEDTLLTELKEAAGADCDMQYLRELLECSVNGESDSTIHINNTNDITDNMEHVSKSAVITYTVSYLNADACEDMLQVIQNRVNALQAEYENSYSNYRFENVADSVYLTTDYDYLTKQKSSVDSLNTYLTTIKNLEGSLSEEDLAYYQATYLEETGDAEKTEEDIEVVEQLQNSAGALMKWLVIGVFLLCVCWGAYYVVKYLLDKHLKRVDEIRELYGLNLVGVLETEVTGRNGIDRWLERMHRRYSLHGDTEDYILGSIDSMGKEKMLLCSDLDNEKIKKYAEALCEKNGRIQKAKFVSLDSAALTEAKTMDGILLLVQIGETQYTEIKRELEVCRMQQIPVLGAIVIG